MNDNIETVEQAPVDPTKLSEALDKALKEGIAEGTPATAEGETVPG